MKKISLFFLLMMLFVITSCSEEKICLVGDKVEIDGISYELISLENYFSTFNAPEYNSDGTLASFNNEDLIYQKGDVSKGVMHRFYYYDMLNENAYPDLTRKTIQEHYKGKNYYPEGTIYNEPKASFANLGSLYPSQTIYMDKEGNISNHNYFIDVYHNIFKFLEPKDSLGRFWIVTGYDYNDVKEEIVIPSSIGNYPVWAIAYRALEGAPMRTFRAEYAGSLLTGMVYFPYSLSNCPNLEKIEMTNGIFLPLSISNMPNNQLDINLSYNTESNIYGIVALDASFYNLNISNLNVSGLYGPDLLSRRFQGYWQNSPYSITGVYNMIFTDCYINSITSSVNRIGDYSPIYVEGNDITTYYKSTLTNSNRYVIGLNKISNSATYTDTPIIRYPINPNKQIFPLVKNGVCESPYVNEMLSRYEGKHKIIILPSLSTSTYYIEDNYIKIRFNYSLDVEGEDGIYKTTNRDVVLSLLEYDQINTYIIENSGVLK